MNDPRYPIGPFIPPAVYTPQLRAEFIDRIAGTPALLRSAVQGLTPDQLSTCYRDGGWTVAQVVHHVADSHMNSYIRFKLALTEDNPTIKPYAEARWAELADASTPDVSGSLALLDALHGRWVVFLRSLKDEQFERTFFHPERGVQVPLDQNLALYAWHGPHHAAHITALREREGWRID